MFDSLGTLSAQTLKLSLITNSASQSGAFSLLIELYWH